MIGAAALSRAMAGWLVASIVMTRTFSKGGAHKRLTFVSEEKNSENQGFRHWEERSDEAIQLRHRRLDCFATLAMTTLTYGSITVSMTWMTPLDCSTSAMVTMATSPLVSVTES